MTRKKYVCAPPPIESLLEEGAGQCFWSEKLISQPDFIQQVKARQTLLQQLQQVFAALPLNLTLADGLTLELIAESEAERLCNLLALYLEGDEAQKRLVLYLPFELLSPITTGTVSVQKASARLQQSYRLAWEGQLSQHEVRANYVDGDVLESELLVGDHPRTVKAAHLIPGLLIAGHITVEEVFDYARRPTDSLLTRSIHEACFVAADLGLLEQDVTVFADYVEQTSAVSLVGLTKGRADWFAAVAKTKALQEKAETIASVLECGAHVSSLLSEQDPLPVALEAVRIAALQNAAVFDWHQDWIEVVAGKEHGPNVRDSLTKLYAHLHARGLVSDMDLQEQGISIPNLGGSFYSNREHLQPPVIDVIGMCKQIDEHSRLSQLVYPAALIFGSQIKGYGLTEADCDIAVFVRPGVSRQERQYLEQELACVYGHERFGGKVTLFWLAEVSDRLQVIDWPDTAASDGESSWIHVLFGALWFGEEGMLRLLHQQLLSTYFAAPQTNLAGKPTYERWLEEMERDSLQYRLLHKGFERYYPIQSPMDTKRGSVIDGKSAFYDPKYRRIATELYVRRVFLPQIK